MKSSPRTLVLAMSFAIIAGSTIANAAVVTDLENSNTVATTFDQATNTEIFGNLPGVTPTVNTEQNAIAELAQFFGPNAKTVLCRYYSEYAVLKDLAIKHGVTTQQRLAETNVIGVTDKAAMLGITDIDGYALKNGLVSADDYRAGGLAYETKVLTAVNADIDARLASGDLKQINRPVVGIVPIQELA